MGLPPWCGSPAVCVDHAARRTRRRSRSKLARPYICRLINLSRVICPSARPLLQGVVSAACSTALVPRAAAAAAPGLMRDGTGSGSWWCRPGCTRAVAGPGVRAAARMGRDAARPERGRPRPHTRPTAQAERPACKPARSAFFAAASGLRTRTRPCLRWRITTPVSHQVRLFCQLSPTSCRVRQIV